MNTFASEIAWPNFDGPTDDSSVAGSQSIQTPVQERLQSDTASPPPIILPRFVRDRGATVADRIHAFNSTTQRATQRADASKHDIVRQPHGPPSPNLAKRMNPFVRQDAAGSVPEPSTSKPPQLHSPVPRRRSTLLARAGKPATIRDTSTDDKLAIYTGPGVGQRTPRHSERGPHMAMGKLPGQQAEFSCTRHGRRLRLKRLKLPTTEGLAKSLSGAYIPNGLETRHQVDATSPYYFASVSLTETGGATLLPEPCSDCLAEENIRQREEAMHHDQPLLSPDEEQHEILSTITEPGTPVHENMTGPTVIGTFQDNQAVLLPGTAVSPAADSSDPAFVASDLGDMIDAIIIEHRGTLNKVITNIRQGLPDKVRMERMSQELLIVSDRFKEVGSPNFSVEDVADGRYSVILDVPPDFVRSRTTSVSDVIDYVHSAAKDLGVKLPVRNFSRPTGSSEVLEVNTRESRDGPLDKTAAILHARAATKSVAPRGQTDSSSIAGEDAESRLPSVEESVEGPTSPLLLAVDVPKAMARSMPVPMIGTESTMQKDFVTSPDDVSRSAAETHMDPATSGSAPPDIGRTDGSSKQSPRPLTTTAPRSQPRRPRESSLLERRQAPWAKSSSLSGSSGASEAYQAIDGTEKGGKSHRSAIQPFIEAQGRDTAAKERAKRRARLSVGSAKTARL